MGASAGQNFDFTRAQKLTKTVYAPKVLRMIPDDLDIIAKDCPFTQKDKLGDKYYVPVQVSRATGVTFNADGSAFAINKGLASKFENAELRGTEILLRDSISYKTLNAAGAGDLSSDAGKRAYVGATKEVFLGLAESGGFFREAMLLYGGGANADASLATVEATTGTSGTTLVLTISAATWAAAMWVGNENAEYDIYSGATKRNTAGSASARTDVYVLTSVDVANRKLTLESEAATNVANVVANDVLWFAGQRTKDMIGIQAACSISGTLWNISNSTYALWKPQTVSAGSGQLSFEILMEALARVANIGYHGTINMYVSPRGWQDLVDDQVALIRYQELKGGQVVVGADDIMYKSQTGTLKIKAHKLVKGGFAFGLPEGQCSRIGSTDLTFEQPGHGKMLDTLPDNAGIQARIYTDQSFFCNMPKAMIMINNIVNSR